MIVMMIGMITIIGDSQEITEKALFTEVRQGMATLEILTIHRIEIQMKMKDDQIRRTLNTSYLNNSVANLTPSPTKSGS